MIALSLLLKIPSMKRRKRTRWVIDDMQALFNRYLLFEIYFATLTCMITSFVQLKYKNYFKTLSKYKN